MCTSPGTGQDAVGATAGVSAATTAVVVTAEEVVGGGGSNHVEKFTAGTGERSTHV